jgi:hypothetical protein
MLEMCGARLWTILTFNLLPESDSLRFTNPAAIAKLHGLGSCVGFLGMLTVAHIFVFGRNANDLRAHGKLRSPTPLALPTSLLSVRSWHYHLW